jgi:hypothetical protein
MGHSEPTHLANPAAGALLGATTAAASAAHCGETSAPAPCCHSEAADGSFNWEAAWIDLGGEG